MATYLLQSCCSGVTSIVLWSFRCSSMCSSPMKTDGYIFTPELLQWRYFHRPVVVQVLIHVLLSSAHNEASAATLSYRDLALQLHTTVKTIRVAIDVLIAEKIITKCSAPRASTKLYVNSSHPLSHCIIPWQRDQGAQVTAHFGAQIGAQSRAQIQSPEVPLNKGDSEDSETSKGTDKGTIKGTNRAQSRAQPKQGAQPMAQSRAQISHSETPLNKGDSEDLEIVKGTDKDIAKGTEVREKKEIKENLSPETPIKENKQRKEKAHPQTQKKEKEKKSGDAETQFSEVLRLFNRLFLGTQVKPISKMTPDRKKLVAKFISDYSFEDIEPMLRKALDSDLLSGRKDGGCYISFNWLFNPKNYEPLMEGTFDNPTIQASATEKKPSKPQQKKTPSPPSSDDSLSIGERWKLAQQSQQSAEAYRDKVNRSIILGHIDNLKKHPQDKQALQSLERFYRDGTIQRLGIDWTPPVEEETKNLLDLDDKTQNYLQSILSD
nr:MAG TPA: Replication initiator A family protein [Caudoviricetes sp.]